MTTEEQKYRAYTFNISGFALMTPFGKICLDPLTFFKQYELVGSVIYILISFGLFISGFMLIEFGRDILYKKGENKWKD